MGKKSIVTNKNSRVITRIDRTGKIRTETTRRDEGQFDVAVSTDPQTGRTQVFFDRRGRDGNFGGRETLRLSGREARTLFIALTRHFNIQGVPALSSLFN